MPLLLPLRRLDGAYRLPNWLSQDVDRATWFGFPRRQQGCSLPHFHTDGIKPNGGIKILEVAYGIGPWRRGRAKPWILLFAS